MSIDKVEYSELATETAPYLTSYIGKGASIDSIVRNLDLDPVLRVENLQELLEYYFVLTGQSLESEVTTRSDADVSLDDTGGITTRGVPTGVLDFVSLLPNRLRSYERATRQRTALFEGEVRGQIDWSRTIKERSRTGSSKEQQYACRVRERTVHTKKNRVLVTLLYQIKEIVERFKAKHDPSSDLEWFSIWTSSGDSGDVLSQQLNNVNLRDLNIEDITVDARTLQDVKNSREPLYREAATLLANFRRLTGGGMHDQEAKQLLLAEPFAPGKDDDSYLFELYWIFKILEELGATNIKHITSESDLIALWEAGGSEYRMYNDWNGRDNNGRDDEHFLEITITDEEVDLMQWQGEPYEEFAHRRHAIHKLQRRVGRSAFNFRYGHPKTPDIIILKLDHDTTPSTLERLFIGEVKYSINNTTIKEGLVQLLEYAIHVKIGEDLQLPRNNDSPYVVNRDAPLDSPVLDLGYFVGHTDRVSGAAPDDLYVFGYGDTTGRPFSRY